MRNLTLNPLTSPADTNKGGSKPTETPATEAAPVTAPIHPMVLAIEGKTNRFHAMFSGIMFKPAGATVKTYDEGGRKTRKLANVLLEMRNPITGQPSGSFIKGSIKAVQNAGAKTAHAEFSAFGSKEGGSSVVLEDEDAVRDWKTFAKDIAADYKVYRQRTGAESEVIHAEEALDGVTL